MSGFPEMPKKARNGSSTPSLGEHHDGSFKVYMQHKKSKLDIQFDKNFSYLVSSSMFHGLSFWVDGYTDPPFEQLKLMVGQHGGHVDNYLSGSITHVIATNFPDSKVKQIREMKKWIPVVYPNWIVDSINAGKLLPHSKYVLPAFQERTGNSIGAALSRVATRQDAPPSTLVQTLPATVSVQTTMAPSKSAGGDPLFMEGYFSSSRLHFIGSARSHVQSIVAQGQRNLGLTAARSHESQVDDSALLLMSPQSGLEATGRDDAVTPPPDVETAQGQVSLVSPVGWPKVIAHVDVDCFFAQVALLDRPDLRELPVVIAHAGARPGGVGLHKKQTFGDGIDSSVTGSAVSLPGRSSAPFSVAGCEPVSVQTVSGEGPRAKSNPPILAKLPPQAKFPKEFNGGEVSSANYPARKYGIQAGMTVMQAMELCPTLHVLPYNFQKITEISESIFQHFLDVTPRVQAMSCDEAYLELTGHVNPLADVEKLRQDVFASTGCTVSAGVGPNMLLARICTSKAKPNGMFVCPADTKVVLDFLAPLAATALPGVGWTNARKLQERGVLTVQQLRDVPKGELEALVGHKLGHRLYEHCRGIDNRSLQHQQVRKSIGAEVNWGIRFTTMNQAREFLTKLSQEVSDRMVKAGGEFPVQPEVPVSARTLTFKLMLRHPEAGEPFKHMGHGHCNNSSKTVQLAFPTHSAEIIAENVIRIFESLCQDASQARGIGIQMTRLCHPGIKQSVDEGSILPFVAAGKRIRSPQHDNGDPSEDSEPPLEKRVRFDVAVAVGLPNDATQPDTPQRGDSSKVIEIIDVATQDPLPTPPSCTPEPEESVVQALTLPPMFRRKAPKKAEVIDLALTQRSAEVTCLSQPPLQSSAPEVHSTMFEHEAFADVVPALGKWVRAIGASPAPHHAKLIASYGKFLTGHGFLDDATQLLRWLDRVSTNILIEARQAAAAPTIDSDILQAWSAHKEGSATWQDAFRVVEAELQRTCYATTGKALVWR